MSKMKMTMPSIKPVGRIWLMAMLVVGTTFFLGCGTREANSTPKKPDKEQNSKKTLYQCPMHPQIIRDKPGSCPICGMHLVPIEDASHEEADSARGAVMNEASGHVVRVSPAVSRNIGMRTEAVHYRTLSSELRLNGKVGVDEERIVSITARVGGYVETLRVISTGQAVKAGETLLELYGPDLVTAQQEYLQGAEGTGAARERLRNWGVSPGFLTRLERTREVRRLIPIAAPIAGTITRKEVVKGQSVSPGMELFRITDLSKIWVTARVYQSDLTGLKVGSKATIRFRNLPDTEFTAEVFFLSPELDPATRTAELRLKLSNTPGQDLRPEMFAEVRVQEQGKQQVLSIPAQSLIRTGGRDMAIVSLGDGRFQPREVKVGRETGEWAEILEGLKEGEEIVVAAQFLIDSESNLRAAVAALRGDGDSREEAGHAQ